MSRLWLALALLALGFLVWRRLRGRTLRAVRGGSRSEQALILELRFEAERGGVSDPRAARLVEALESEMRRALAKTGAGELEEHSQLGDAWIVYLYGRDAERLFDAVAPALRHAQIAPGSRAVKRYGPPGAAERWVALPPDAT